MSHSVLMNVPSSSRPETPAFRTSQVVLLSSALLFALVTLIDFRTKVEIAQAAGLDDAKAIIGGGASLVLGLLLYFTVYTLMKNRWNNGRMIGMGLAVLGFLMGMINGILDVPEHLLNALVYFVIAALSIVWLVITNKREVTDLLRK